MCKDETGRYIRGETIANTMAPGAAAGYDNQYAAQGSPLPEPHSIKLARELELRRSHHQRELDKVTRAIEMATANPVLLESIEFARLIENIR
jgi:hypothetical protein